MIRRALALLVAFTALAAPAAALAAQPRTTLNDIEDEVMCVVCGVPLNIAESPQADRERALIRRLIDQGLTKDQIKKRLVAQYGDQVLASPTGGGFDVTNWLVPAIVVLGLAAAIGILVPRWRRRGAAPSAPGAAGPALDPDDERRLEEDLARYR